ncbi:MAG: InlB B-repeat-containing protein [Chitinispirillales bacterium]|jgi:hypothetical protein|nr:InlB B-repeat-containing protein [Chitinispirillales bacterium]
MATITFNSNGGSAVDSITADAGAMITLPLTKRSGFFDNGWLKTPIITVEQLLNLSEEEVDAKFVGNPDDTFTLNENLNVFMLWVEGNIITFNSNGGSAIDQIQTTRYDEIITLPNSTKDSYALNGWYSALTGGTRIGGANEVINNPNSTITWYAQWMELPSSEVNFKGNDGVPESQIKRGEIGSKISADITPLKQNKLFRFWSSDSKGTDNLGTAVEVLSQNRSVFAQFKRDWKFFFFSETDEEGNKTYIAERFQTKGVKNKFYKILRDTPDELKKFSILYKILERKGKSYADN